MASPDCRTMAVPAVEEATTGHSPVGMTIVEEVVAKKVAAVAKVPIAAEPVAIYCFVEADFAAG